MEDLDQKNNLTYVLKIPLRELQLAQTINTEADKEATEIIQSRIMSSWTSSKIDILSQVRTGQLSGCI